MKDIAATGEFKEAYVIQISLCATKINRYVGVLWPSKGPWGKSKLQAFFKGDMQYTLLTTV